MLDSEYKGGLFEGLNTIIRMSDEIEKEDPVELIEQVPYGVENSQRCEVCDEFDCICDEGDVEDTGSAGNQPLSASAILGSIKADDVGNSDNPQMIKESKFVTDVQDAIKSNIDNHANGEPYDPLKFFKGPLKIDMYNSKTSYGNELIK